MHPAIEEFEVYWNNLRGEAIAPSKSSFNISDLRGAMWKLIDLLQVERNPRRFKYVVFGHARTSSYGDDLTGKYVDEIDLGTNAARYLGNFDKACTTRQPVLDEDEYLKEDGSRHKFEGGCFPLLGSDGETSHLVTVAATYRNGICYTPW